MSFISRFKYPALTCAILIVALLEILARVLPIEYTSGAGIFITERRRAMVEASSPEFDYIILGDSRSLSLDGHRPDEKEPFSVYNLSIPAMGPRYFRYYLEKYLENRKKKPAAVIFAGDPGLFQKSWNTPSHDPKMLYADTSNDSLSHYLANRFTRRLNYFFAGRYPMQKDEFGTMVWEAFSHRYLHTFGPVDMMHQYNGAERIFMLRESIPNLLYLYRFRDGIKQYTVDIRANSFRTHPIPEACEGCAQVAQPMCHPDYSRAEDNRLLEEHLAQHMGGINLADRLAPKDRATYYAIREAEIKKQVYAFGSMEPDLAPVEALIRVATDRGIPIVFSDVPTVEAYRSVRYYKLYFEQLNELLKKYPLAKLIRFPEPYYPIKLFVEQVHYECEGAQRLNREFYQNVMPEIMKFAPVKQP